MTVPTVATYSVAAISAATTALLNLIDAGSTAGLVVIKDANDDELAVIELADPAGTVNGGTGKLSLTVPKSDPSADATGVAAYAEITDSDNTVILSLPVEEGTTAVPGKIVLSSLSIAAGAVVTLTSGIIG